MSGGAESARVFLIGGGWDGTVADVVYGPFLRAAASGSAMGSGADPGAGGGSGPRVLCVLVDEGDGAEQFARYDAALRKAGPCTPVPLLVPVGQRFDVGALSGDVDGVLVCGGPTPAYQEAFAGQLRSLPALLAERGVPYAGFSAGAAVAARDAVVGGG